MKRGKGVTTFNVQDKIKVNGKLEFEIVDKDGNFLIPDFYDIVCRYFESKDIDVGNYSRKLARKLNKYMSVNQGLRNSPRLEDIEMILDNMFKFFHERVKDKEWRKKGALCISVGDGFTDNSTDHRAIAIDYNIEEGTITWMPDWGIGEGLFRHYAAGGVETEKSKIWRENLEYNLEKTGFKKGIKEFKGLGKGKTGIIVGNGPSLRRNAEYIQKHPNAIVIGCNAAFDLFDDYNEIFDFYSIVDHNTTEKTKNWLFDKEGNPKPFDGTFIANITALKHYADAYGDRIHWFAGSDVVRGLAESFSKSEYPPKKMKAWAIENGYDFKYITDRGDYWEVPLEVKWANELGWCADSKTVLLYNMHFLYYTMEVDQIVLVGFDFGSSPDGFWDPKTPLHYYPDAMASYDNLGFLVWTRPMYETARRQAEMACLFVTDAGCPVINASQGGCLQWPLRMGLKTVYDNLDDFKGFLKPYLDEAKAAEKESVDQYLETT